MSLIWSNFQRHKLRSFLLTLVALTAFLIFGTLGGALNAINPSDTVGDSDELMVHSTVNLLAGLPSRYGETIGQIQGVADWAPVLMLASYFGEESNLVTAEMTDVEKYLDFFTGEIILANDARERLINTRDGVIIDRDLAERYDWAVGDRFALTSDLIRQKNGSGDWSFQVVGIYDEASEDGGGGVIGHYKYLEGNVLAFENKFHWFMVRTVSPDLNDQVSQRIDEAFANSPDESLTLPAAAMARAFLSQVGDLTFIVQIVVGAAFMTMLLVVGNSISLSVQQRTKEIGVLRTLGFSKARIFMIIFAETATLIFVAFGLGMLLSAFIVAGIFEAFTGADMGTLYLPLSTFLMGLLLAFIVAILTGGLPSYRAMRLKPTEAFRRG